MAPDRRPATDEPQTPETDLTAVFGVPRPVDDRLLIPLTRRCELCGQLISGSGQNGWRWVWTRQRPVGVIELSPDGVAVHRLAGPPWPLLLLILVAWGITRFIGRARTG